MKGKQNRGTDIQVDYIGTTDDLVGVGPSGDSARGQSGQIQSGEQSGGQRAQVQRGELNRGQGDSARGQSQSDSARGQSQGQGDFVDEENNLSAEEQGKVSYE
jgi:hypothetical protein